MFWWVPTHFSGQDQRHWLHLLRKRVQHPERLQRGVQQHCQWPCKRTSCIRCQKKKLMWIIVLKMSYDKKYPQTFKIPLYFLLCLYSFLHFYTRRWNTLFCSCTWFPLQSSEGLDLSDAEASYQDGFLTCSYTRHNSVNASQVVYDITPPNEYYLIMALGPTSDLSKSNNAGLGYSQFEMTNDDSNQHRVLINSYAYPYYSHIRRPPLTA